MLTTGVFDNHPLWIHNLTLPKIYRAEWTNMKENRLQRWDLTTGQHSYRQIKKNQEERQEWKQDGMLALMGEVGKNDNCRGEGPVGAWKAASSQHLTSACLDLGGKHTERRAKPGCWDLGWEGEAGQRIVENQVQETRWLWLTTYCKENCRVDRKYASHRATESSCEQCTRATFKEQQELKK